MRRLSLVWSVVVTIAGLSVCPAISAAQPGTLLPGAKVDPVADSKTFIGVLTCLEAAGESAPARAACLTSGVSDLMSRFQLGEIVGQNEKQYVRAFGDIDKFVIGVHAAYKKIKDKAKDASPDDRDTQLASATQLGTVIHDRLTEMGLNEPLNAIIRTGFSLTDAGDEFPDKFGTGAPSHKNSSLAFIEFESQHFGDDTPAADFSFGGTVGLGPTMAIAAPRPVESGDDESGGEGGNGEEQPDAAPLPLVPVVLNSFNWSLNARLNFRTSHRSELSALARTGQARLDDLTAKLGDGEDAALADVVRNGTGRWAFHRETGFEFRFYDKTLDAIHSTKDMLLPLFSIGGGWRWDDRLKAKGPLAEFTNAEKRYFGRFTVNLVKIFDPNNTDPAKKPFSLKFTVDHQRARKSEAPSSTRILIEATADVLKMFGFGEEEPAPAPPAPAAPAAAPPAPPVREPPRER